MEKTYYPEDLKKGKCKCCSEKSSEIVIGDGRCIDCIAADEFYEKSMKGVYDKEN